MSQVNDITITEERHNRLLKMEQIVKIFAKIMFYCNWKWETPNERIIEFLMREIDLFEWKTEDDLIKATEVDEGLYEKSLNDFNRG